MAQIASFWANSQIPKEDRSPKTLLKVSDFIPDLKRKATPTENNTLPKEDPAANSLRLMSMWDAYAASPFGK